MILQLLLLRPHVAIRQGDAAFNFKRWCWH